MLSPPPSIVGRKCSLSRVRKISVRKQSFHLGWLTPWQTADECQPESKGSVHGWLVGDECRSHEVLQKFAPCAAIMMCHQYVHKTWQQWEDVGSGLFLSLFEFPLMFINLTCCCLMNFGRSSGLAEYALHSRKLWMLKAPSPGTLPLAILDCKIWELTWCTHAHG